LCIIEWPERGAGVLPEPDLQVRVGVVQDEKKGIGRTVSLNANTSLASAAIAALAEKK
jgi:tRNA threonylcarbamoyladenosine biosynthesis protein TsaE